MARPEKEKLVEELSQKLSQNEMSILTEYTGLTVLALTQIREQLRKASIEYRVFKNTLARIAARNTGLEGVLDFIERPTGYVFSNDPVMASKILADFIKTNPNMKIKCGVLKGRVLKPAQVQALASLPPKKILIGQLLGQMQSPISGLVNVLNGPVRNLVYVLDELRKKKEAA
ncbi:50S ribosomal protein L10 [Candidatus Poribacteria bacterium]|nr:50S ribosomal protein L10 [Candidatus Poribacteria bacterium]